MIRLVTDSGSQITPELQRHLGALVVPMTVTVDGTPLLEGSEIDLDGITDALARGADLGSSTPSPGQFLSAYEKAAADGATAIVSVHMGGAASGTANAARVAAGLAPVPVEVVDTGSASFPVTMALWAAGDALIAGATAARAAQVALDTAAAMGNVFVVGTLALARRGGRLADGVEGVPVLALADGQMKAVGQVADEAQVVEQMASYVEEHAAGRVQRIGVGHLAAPELADALEVALRQRVQVEQLVRYSIGPSIAVHTGLGTAGCVFHPV